MLPRIRRWWALALMLGAGACGTESTFVCSDDSSCADGRCEPIGYCSFPAADCPSGWRYGQFSGPFAGQCVMDDDALPTSTAGSGASSTAADGDGATGQPETSSASSVDSDGPDASGGLPDCAGGSSCFEIPQGWDGPVRLFDDGGACAEVVHEGALSYEGAWECSCSCEPTGPTSCADVDVELQIFEGAGCPGAPFATEQLSETCQDFDYAEPHSLRAVAGGMGSCDADTVVDAEAVAAVEPRAVCGVSASPPCSGGVCTSDVGLCIHAQGEVECPAGFDERTVVYASFADGRGCSSCACEAPYSCGGSYQIKSAEVGCENPGSVFLPIGPCSGPMLFVRGGQTGETNADPDFACELSGGEQEGLIQPLVPRTICC